MKVKLVVQKPLVSTTYFILLLMLVKKASGWELEPYLYEPVASESSNDILGDDDDESFSGQ